MKRLLLFILLSPAQAFCQNSQLPDYKTLGKEYINAAFNNDTITLAKECSQNCLLAFAQCSKDGGDTTVNTLMEYIKNDYPMVFHKVYVRELAILHNKFSTREIDKIDVDSIGIKLDVDSPPECKDYTLYTMSIYLKSNGKDFKTEVGVMEFEKKWRIMDIEPILLEE